MLAAAYGVGEFVNVVTDYSTVEKDGALKAIPSGAGRTMRRDEWMRWVRERGSPESEAGGWIRMNPTKAAGSGKGGAIRDADVTSCRFVLLESDWLPMELALRVFPKTT